MTSTQNIYPHVHTSRHQLLHQLPCVYDPPTPEFYSSVPLRSITCDLLTAPISQKSLRTPIPYPSKTPPYPYSAPLHLNNPIIHLFPTPPKHTTSPTPLHPYPKKRPFYLPTALPKQCLSANNDRSFLNTPDTDSSFLLDYN